MSFNDCKNLFIENDFKIIGYIDGLYKVFPDGRKEKIKK